MNGAELRAARRVHDGHGHLESARGVEHDPVDFPVAVGDLYELELACALHGVSVATAVVELEYAAALRARYSATTRSF